MSADQPTGLTSRLLDLVAVDRNSRPPPVGLSSSEVDTLIAVVRGRQRAPEPLSAVRALQALALGAPVVRARPVLMARATDPSASLVERMAATRGLAQVVTTPAVERTLLDLARTANDHVQRVALAGLGRFGGPSVLDELRRADPPSSPATVRQLALAQALIAHRHGLDGPFLPPRRQHPDRVHEDTIRFVVRRRSPQSSAADRAAWLGPDYGVELADSTYGFTCGRTRWTLFLHAALGDPIDRVRLLARPWIAGVLGTWIPPRIALTARLVVLTRPSQEGLRIDVVRGDGVVTHAGTGQLTDDGLSLAVTETDHPGNWPVRLTGLITPRGALRLEGVAAGHRMTAKPVIAALPVPR